MPKKSYHEKEENDKAYEPGQETSDETSEEEEEEEDQENSDSEDSFIRDAQSLFKNSKKSLKKKVSDESSSSSLKKKKRKELKRKLEEEQSSSSPETVEVVKRKKPAKINKDSDDDEDEEKDVKIKKQKPTSDDDEQENEEKKMKKMRTGGKKKPVLFNDKNVDVNLHKEAATNISTKSVKINDKLLMKCHAIDFNEMQRNFGNNRDNDYAAMTFVKRIRNNHAFDFSVPFKDAPIIQDAIQVFIKANPVFFSAIKTYELTEKK